MRPAIQVEKPVKQASKKSLLLPAKLKVCDYIQTKFFFDPGRGRGEELPPPPSPLPPPSREGEGGGEGRSQGKLKWV